MNSTRIQLIGDVTGYLDLKEGTAFPINISLSDIRDISKRNGSYSKTITLIGNHNNNKLLGNIFDINIVDGSFNINTLQECLVEQDGVVILDNMYIQLTSIKKVQPDASYDYAIEYEVEIKDSSSDFFTKIQNLELTDLDLSAFNHVYEISAITQSFDNTYVDGYKYLLPYNDTPNYIIQDFKPAVYNRIYWDQIFDNAGYTYTFDEQDNLDIRFNELIIPYNGDKPKPIEDQALWVEAHKSTSFTFSQTQTGGTYPSPIGLILDVEDKDDSNYYNPVTGEYSVPFEIINPDSIQYEFIVNYDFSITNNSGSFLILNGPGTVKRYGLELFGNLQSETSQPFFFNNGATISNGQTIVLGTDVQSSIVVKASPLNIGDVITNKIRAIESSDAPLRWKTTGLAERYITIDVTINSIQVVIKPSLDTFILNTPLGMNSFIPKKIKQSEYIKSICQMFNLYLETDKDDITNIIIRTRDEFYDSGEVKNWSDKLAKDSDQNIKFLPELSNKKVILTYKDDKDTLNSNYKNIINETYGQLEYVFENDYIRDVERKEIIFSPTPILYTDFQAVVPSLVGIAPNCNIRILLDNGVKGCLDWTINVTQSSAVTLDYYPLLSHFAGDPENPVFDINYGTCDFYFYNPDNIEIIKRNNLYYSHWERTLNQINNGKLLTVSFELDAIDILNLKLNDKIFIDNSYWNINKVIDYDPNSNNLTRVELISIDDDLELPDIIVKTVYQPVNGDIELVDKGKLTNGVGKTKWIYTNIDASNGKTDIKGIQNQTSNLTSGYIDGDRNIISAAGYTEIKGSGNTASSATFIWGNNNTIEADLEKTFSFVDGYSITQSNTFVIPENLVLDGLNPTINGLPINDLGIWEKTVTSPTSDYSIFNKEKGHIISVDSFHSFIGGGQNNTIIADSVYSSIIGGHDNSILGSNRSVILGGSFMTAPKDDTVYVPYLNIRTLAIGTPVASLAVDALGNVVAGSTASLPTSSTWADVLSNGNNSGPNDVIIDTTQVITSSNGDSKLFMDFGGIADNIQLQTGAGNNFLNIDDAVGTSTLYSINESVIIADQVVNISSGEIVNLGIALGGSEIQIISNDISSKTSTAIDKEAIFIGTNNSTIGAGVVGSVVLGGNDNVINSYGSLVSGDTNSISDSGSYGSVIFGGSGQEITNGSPSSAILGGDNNRINGATRTVVLGGNNIADATYDNTVYQQDSYRDASNHTVTTTNNTITDLYTFTPDSDGVWNIEWMVTGFETATGDAIGAKAFATFKVIAGVVTQVATQTIDRKSNFPAPVTVTLDTDGTLIRARVTGRIGSTIDWRGSLTITK